MLGWHHQLKGHEFEQTPGAGDGQGGVACYSPWSCKETRLSDVTELKHPLFSFFYKDVTDSTA